MKVRRFDYLRDPWARGYSARNGLFITGHGCWCVVVDAKTGVAYSLYSRAGCGGAWAKDEVSDLIAGEAGQ